jgi:drug/metabolite transporter (DMT)-like permease
VLRATLLVVLAACGFGSISSLVYLGTVRGGAPLLSVLFWRYLIGAALLAVASGRAALGVPRRRVLALAALGGGGQALIALLSLSALRYISLATLGFLFYTYPAWVTVFAAVTGADRLTRTRLAALALSLGGIVLMVGAPGGGAMHPTGVALALASAVIYAVYIPLIGRLQRGLAPEVASAYAVAGAATVFLILGVLSAASGGAVRALLGELRWALTPVAWLAAALRALVATVVSFIAFLRGLAVLGPVRTAIVSTVEPFWTAVLGWLAFRQPLTATTLAGGAMIAAAVLALQRKPRASGAAGAVEGVS